MEWMLNPGVFKILETVMGPLDIDMFASKYNHQTPLYVSFQPDSQAMAVDAFTLNWKRYSNMYLFPPFSVINRTIQKVTQEKVSYVLLIAPIWTTQVWFSTLLQHISGQSYILPKHCLQLPNQLDKKHPIHNLRLGAFILSGNSSAVEAYQGSLLTSSCGRGDN